MWLDPGGVVSVLLLFPVIFYSSKVAGAHPIEKTRSRWIWTGIVLGMCALLAAIIPPLGLITFVVILFYRIFCGIQIMRRGEGSKRFLLGAVLIVATPLTIVYFWASVHMLGSRMAASEASAVGTLRTLSTAEKRFGDLSSSGPTKEMKYGTIENLRKSELIDDSLSEGRPHIGYVFHEIVDPAKTKFLFYAVPALYAPPQSEPDCARFFPGSALYYNVLRYDETHGTGARSFAVDETGVLRSTTSRITRPLQREEIERWEPL
jgi:hypothetical protein